MITTSSSLLESLRDGQDQRAWQAFFRTYAPLLTAFSKQLGLSDADAADAVQETLVAVYRTFSELEQPFDRTRGRFKSWLRGVAQHKIRDVQRRRVRAEQAQDRLKMERPDPTTNSGEADRLFELEWQRNLLARALEQVASEVDPVVYQAFELYAVQGQPPEQVAKLLGTTRNAVYISKTRVIQRLRAVLEALRCEEG